MQHGIDTWPLNCYNVAMKKIQKSAVSKTREKPLRIRLMDDERRLLDEVAREKGLPTATWARMELLGIAKISPQK